ncbi:hypothetical protein FF38_04878 [Lucilia cuprina]|uniref:Uncharacterized protein n=1 Tax=Lucilia cuprina TaxID=7375 RepID=A0A0L0C8Q5_LUCCU|nr:hypothetical protein FF38_04878 [Lucilia cuprina]
MGNVHAAQCVPTSVQDVNNNIPGLMKRTCQRMSLKREKMPTPTQSTKSQKSNRKRIVLKAMPRCSSFDDLSSLLPSSKKVDNDPTYLLWKKSFECPRDRPETDKQKHLRRMKKRVHDMTSAVSGHITPKGFPSYTNLKPINRNINQNQYKKELLQLPLPDDSLHAECKNQLFLKNISPQRLSTVVMCNNIPNTNSETTIQPKYTLAPLNLLSKLSQKKQAILIEQLFRDIKKFESHYDTNMDSFIF